MAGAAGFGLYCLPWLSPPSHCFAPTRATLPGTPAASPRMSPRWSTPLASAPRTPRRARRPSARSVRFYVANGLLDRPEGTGTSATYNYRHFLQLLAIKIRQREGATLEQIKSEMKEVAGDALERRVAGSLAPALGAGSDRAVQPTTTCSAPGAASPSPTASRSTCATTRRRRTTMRCSRCGKRCGRRWRAGGSSRSASSECSAARDASIRSAARYSTRDSIVAPTPARAPTSRAA